MVNILNIFERKFVEKVTQNSKVDQELWKILQLETKRMRVDYDECIKYLDKMIEKISVGKEKVTNHHLDAWEGLQLIIDHSLVHRQN